MSQQEPSKGNKRVKKKTYAKPGSLSFLANKKRQLLTTNEIVEAIQSEKGHLLKLIQEQQPVAPQSEANGQSVDEQTLEEQVGEDQLEMNFFAPPINEQPEEQAEGISTRKTRGTTQIHKEKYLIPEAAKKWTLATIREAWRRHRRQLKLNHYDPYDNDEVLMENKPGHIPECQFKELFKYWKSDKFKKMSETNTKNRKKLMNPHTAAKRSFALVRTKLEKYKEIVSQKEVFVATRTRKFGRLYKASNENTINKIAEMEKIEKEMSVNGESIDAFSVVMGPEHLGSLRLYGLGVTKTSLKKMEVLHQL